MSAAFMAGFHEFTPDGEVVVRAGSIDFWEQNFAAIRAGGWRGAESNTISAYAFGPRQVLVEASWKHFHDEGSSYVTCNTYIVVGSGDSWTITSGMDVECSDQGIDVATHRNP